MDHRGDHEERRFLVLERMNNLRTKELKRRVGELSGELRGVIERREMQLQRIQFVQGHASLRFNSCSQGASEDRSLNPDGLRRIFDFGAASLIVCSQLENEVERLGRQIANLRLKIDAELRALAKTTRRSEMIEERLDEIVLAKRAAKYALEQLAVDESSK